MPDTTDNLEHVDNSRAAFWAEIVGRSRLRLIAVGALLFVMAAGMHVVDPFGLSNSSAETSRDLTKRVMTPWFGWSANRWNVPARQDVTTVVTFQRQPRTLWPPSYEEQADALARVASACPAVIAIDILYDIERATPFSTIMQAMQRAVAGAADCEHRPVVVFADYDTPQPAESLIPSVAEAVSSGDCLAEEDYVLLSGLLGPDIKPCEGKTIGGQILPLFGTVQWPGNERRPNNPWFGLNYEDYYLPVLEPDPEDASTVRPTLALQSYEGWCAFLAAIGSGWNCNREEIDGTRDLQTAAVDTDPAAGPAMAAPFADTLIDGARAEAPAYRANPALTDAVGRGVTAVDAFASAQRYRPDAAAHFRAPADIQWPRWSPSNYRSYWGSWQSEPWWMHDVFGAPSCVLDHIPSDLERAGESLRLLFLGALSTAPLARDEEKALCYPLVTLDARRHILRNIDCEASANPRDCLKLLRSYEDRVTGVVSHLRHKAVFVGFSDLEGGDTAESPAHSTLPGVYRHAMFFDNLVRHGTDYRRVPETNLFPSLPVPIGWTAIIELVTMALLTLALIRFRNGRALARRWQDLAAEAALPPHQTSPPKRTRLFLSGLWSEIRMLAGMPVVLLGVALGIAMLGTILFKWSTVNWIGAAALGIVPSFYIALRLRDAGPKRERLIPAAQTTEETDR